MDDIRVLENVMLAHLAVRLPFLLLLSAITLGIQVVRSRLYSYEFYRPFWVNIVLAWIPFVLSILAYGLFLRADLQASLPLIIILLVWFVFFPNSVYLITEVHHFRDETDVPLWFDTIAILLIVVTGIMLGIHSLGVIHFFLDVYMSTELTWFVLVAYVYLATFGIFIGRYLRFNSWDVLQKPWTLFREIAAVLDTPKERRDMLIFTSLFTLFIVGFYIFDVHLPIWTGYVLELRLNEWRELAAMAGG